MEENQHQISKRLSDQSSKAYSHIVALNNGSN